MAVFQNNLLAGAGAQSSDSTFSIDQSIRFNSADDGNMYRVVGSGGNTKTWTFSGWFKLGLLGSQRGASPFLWSGYQDDSNRLQLMLDNAVGTGAAGDFLCLYSSTSGSIFQTTRVFRDPSAWYHIVVVSDTSNAVSSERIRLYINGIRETSFSTINYPSLNADLAWNKDGSTWYLGKYYSGSGSGTYNYDGYMAELVNLDGTATDCNSFGEFNSNGIWVPKDVSGLSFGTKGWYIDGRDSSDLGDDESGNGNDFSTSGLASHDQMADSPTNNFAVINAVYADNASAGNAGTLSNGNLQYVGGGSTFSVKGFTFDLPKSGKWYFEYMIGGNNDGFGFVKQGEQGTINASNGPGQLSVAQGGGIQYTGWRNGGNNTTTFADSNTGSPFTAGFIHQVAIDVDNGKFYYGVKNTYYAADGGDDGDPSGGTNHMSTFAFSTTDVVLLAGNYSGTQYWNFGQDGTFSGQQTAQGNSDANGVGNFYYAPPTNYLALCTKNLGS